VDQGGAAGVAVAQGVLVLAQGGGAQLRRLGEPGGLAVGDGAGLARGERGVGGDGAAVCGLVGCDVGFGRGDVGAVDELLRNVFFPFFVVVEGSERFEVLLMVVESGAAGGCQRRRTGGGTRGCSHCGEPFPDVALPFDLDIGKSLSLELGLSEGAAAAGYGARGWPMGENAVDAGFAHAVVAFGVDEKPHLRVEVAGGLAYRADIWRRSAASIPRPP
jgi:hypothetical protein